MTLAEFLNKALDEAGVERAGEELAEALKAAGFRVVAEEKSSYNRTLNGRQFIVVETELL